ncbi:MAG: hypothetical protein J5554_11070 [Paludibacteraceae bacterium]|nr:hypothetical protein [Paludibacteraceae bacterium]
METDEENKSSKVHQQDKFGEKWELPYTLRNVQAAYDSLKAGNLLRSGEVEPQLQATHYYVRFLPKDSSDWAELLKDTNIVLTEIPWDREVEGEGGESYHDPYMGKNVPTWQYTKVPVDYQFSNVKYEILDELCILPEFELSEEDDKEDIEDGGNLRIQEVPSFGKQLQMAALRRAGYIKEDDSTSALPLRSWLSKTLKKLDPTWTPKANIRAWDDLLGKYIPLKGVKVYINHGGVWYYRTTDEDGYVKFPTCVGPVVYKIEWSGDYWQIFDDYYLPAYYSRSGSNRSTWNLDISGGKSLHYACIHRAAMRHFYGDNCGIVRPYFKNKHKISYFDESDTGSFNSESLYFSYGTYPDIKIYGKSGTNYKSTNLLTKTAMHEFSHSSHCLSVGYLVYDYTSDYVKEAWTVAATYYLMKKEYEELGAGGNLLNTIKTLYAYQKYDSDDIYSPLMLDLIDNENEKILLNNRLYPDDQVSGYTLSTIQKCLNTANTVSAFKRNIKANKPNGVTDAKIDLLFKTFEERWKK